jgi:MFS transporter, ACDE family, multidrug resistance protein
MKTVTDSYRRRQFSLAALFFLVASSKTLLLSLIPLGALQHFGDAQKVSLLYFCVSFVGIFTSILIPQLIRRRGASGALSLGAVSLALGAPLMSHGASSTFVIGMALHLYGYLAMEIGLTLMLLQRIPREEMAAFEPNRVLFQAISYMIGPWLGVSLSQNLGVYVPYLASVCLAALAVVLMIAMRLHISPTPSVTSNKPRSAFGNVRRFISQPRMRLAWFITLGRAAWWNIFFIYTPIYAVTNGLGEIAGAAIVSTGVGFVLSVHFWSWLGRKNGFRNIMTISFVLTAFCLGLLGLFDVPPLLGAALLILSALCSTPLDASGNLAYLKFVKRNERAEMTGVFQTYRDASQLLPPGLFAVALKVFELPAVFVITAMGLLGVAKLTRFLPRRF